MKRVIANKIRPIDCRKSSTHAPRVRPGIEIFVVIDASSPFSDQNPKEAFCITFTLTAKVKGSAITFAMLAQASESAMNHVVGLNPQMPRGETRTRTEIAL